MKPRLKHDARRAALLAVALDQSEKHSYLTLRRDDVAAAAGVSGTLIIYYFASMKALRAEVMQSAIDNRVYRVVAQGLAHNDPVALAAPEWVRFKAMRAIS